MELTTTVFVDMARPINLAPSYICGKKGRARIYWRGHQMDLPGKKDSPESLQAFHQIASIIAVTGKFPGTENETKKPTVRDLSDRYLKYCQNYYTGSREAVYIGYAIKELCALWSDLQADEFTPLHLRAVRTALINRGQVRRTVNKRSQQIVACYAWGVVEGLIDPSVWYRLKAIRPIPKGREGAKDNPEKRPVPDSVFKRTIEVMKPHLVRSLWVQYHTGMRSQELLKMRPQDVDMRGSIWIYTIEKHKTVQKTGIKYVAIPKAAVEILQSCMPKHYSDRWFPWSVGWQRRAVEGACKRAGVAHWHPHQLRHGLATRISERISIEAARVLLGHTDVRTTKNYAAVSPEQLLELAEKAYL